MDSGILPWLTVSIWSWKTRRIFRRCLCPSLYRFRYFAWAHKDVSQKTLLSPCQGNQTGINLYSLMSSTKQPVLSDLINFLLELDSIILMGPFQLRTFYCIIIQTAMSIDFPPCENKMSCICLKVPKNTSTKINAHHNSRYLLIFSTYHDYFFHPKLSLTSRQPHEMEQEEAGQPFKEGDAKLYIQESSSENRAATQHIWPRHS